MTLQRWPEMQPYMQTINQRKFLKGLLIGVPLGTSLWFTGAAVVWVLL